MGKKPKLTTWMHSLASNVSPHLHNACTFQAIKLFKLSFIGRLPQYRKPLLSVNNKKKWAWIIHTQCAISRFDIKFHFLKSTSLVLGLKSIAAGRYKFLDDVLQRFIKKYDFFMGYQHSVFFSKFRQSYFWLSSGI